MKVSRHRDIFDGLYHISVGLSHHQLTVKGADSEFAICDMCISTRVLMVRCEFAVSIKVVVRQQADTVWRSALGCSSIWLQAALL